MANSVELGRDLEFAGSLAGQPTVGLRFIPEFIPG